MSVNLIKYLPEFYHHFPQIEQLMNSESLEIAQLKTALEWLLSNQFISTATDTLKKREGELAIDNREGEGLDYRRLRLINRYSTRPPFTMRFLEEQIRALAEGREVTISQITGEYKVKANMLAQDTDIITEVDRTINVYLPANMLCQIGVADDNKIVLAEQAIIKEYDLFTKLGEWSLGNIAFGALVNEVTIID